MSTEKNSNHSGREVSILTDDQGNIIRIHDPKMLHNDEEAPIENVEWPIYETKRGKDFRKNLPS